MGVNLWTVCCRGSLGIAVFQYSSSAIVLHFRLIAVSVCYVLSGLRRIICYILPLDLLRWDPTVDDGDLLDLLLTFPTL